MNAARLKSFLLAIALAATSTGAMADDQGPAVADLSVAIAAQGKLPDLNADEYFKGRGGGTFGKDIVTMLPNSKRVAVAGFRVVYVIESSASAHVRSSYLPGGVEKTAAHSSIDVKLAGVDNATLQAITDKAYANFLEQLKAAGREVVPPEQLATLYPKLDVAKTSADAPYQKDVGGKVGVAFSPTGVPLWWTVADSYGDVGPFNQTNMRAVPPFSAEANAIVIAPMIVVDFAKMGSSGNHSALINDEAKVDATLRMAVPVLTSGFTRAAETKGGLTSSGDDAFFKLTKALVVDQEFATMETVEEEKSSKMLAFLTGSAKSSKKLTATTDNTRYSAVASQVLNQATGALAKFFQQHPAQ
ncbi:MAG TPA: hypothetical protein VHE37_15180 [Nevskiaceae bacterium]|nr:hypothetical protein [Nevskiaceae bacterium]